MERLNMGSLTSCSWVAGDQHRKSPAPTSRAATGITSSSPSGCAGGIRDEGGVAFEFPIHPIQETLKRPTAALDRNLQYLSLVEILYGWRKAVIFLTVNARARATGNRKYAIIKHARPAIEL
jgi:hypothetical protein